MTKLFDNENLISFEALIVDLWYLGRIHVHVLVRYRSGSKLPDHADQHLVTQLTFCPIHFVLVYG